MLDAVVKAVMSLAECRDQLVARVLEMHRSGGDLAAAQRSLQAEESKLTGSIANLCLAIEKGGDGMDSLVHLLADREQRLKVVRSRLAELSSQTAERKPPPTAEEILGHLESLQAGLVAGDRRAGVILRQLLNGPIRAIPHQQFDSNKVVLRGEFDLILTRSLPAGIAESTADELESTAPNPQLFRQCVAVDLFKPSDLVRHAAEAHSLVETGISLVKVGKALGISKRQAHLSSQLGAKLADAGVIDPFIRLTERPETVSRWRGQQRPPGERSQREAG